MDGCSGPASSCRRLRRGRMRMRNSVFRIRFRSTSRGPAGIATSSPVGSFRLVPPVARCGAQSSGRDEAASVGVPVSAAEACGAAAESVNGASSALVGCLTWRLTKPTPQVKSGGGTDTGVVR